MSEKLAIPGRVKEISSLSNPIVKDLRLLEKKRHREDTNRFVAEGMKLVIDALDLGWSLDTLIYAASKRGDAKIGGLAAKALAKGADILIVPEKVLGAITRRDNPQMVVGVFKRRFAKASAVTDGSGDVWVALDRVRDPGNLGTVIRTIDAVGAKGVILIGDTTDPFSPETVRATMGSIFGVNIIRMAAEDFASFANTWSGRIVGTHMAGETDFRNVDYGGGPTILLMGNEQQGLTDALVEACTDVVRIPQAGRADSLNLAVATAICLYEAKRESLALEPIG
ncbi:MAG: RNA methyltransferase [Pseudomonadota bacterium]